MNEKEKLSKLFEWAEEMLEEIDYHATEKNCHHCQKLIRKIYQETQKLKI